MFILFSLFLAYDVGILIFSPSVEILQILVEGGIFLIGILAFHGLWTSSQQVEISEVRHREEIQKMKAEKELYKKDFLTVIESHFEIWGLTETEKIIGLYLLRGFSFSEIAQIRSVSERTIRNQSMAIYSKSGLSGKHELAAYFLEELLGM